DQCEVFFLGEFECDTFQLLNQSFAGLASIEMMLPSGGGFSRFTFHPLPDLPRLRRVGEDNEMFVCGFSELPLDLSADVVIRERSVTFTNERRHPALFRDG